MKTSSWKIIVGGIAILMSCAVTQLHAQGARPGGGFGGGGFGGGGFGGFGGGGFGGFGGNRGFGAANNSSSSAYNNNGSVGGASFMVDPDTHTITYIADKQTSEAISNVIANLDRPKPQVLIKVVFLEVDLNSALDIGVEGGWTGGSDPTHSIGSIFGLTGLNNIATNITTPAGQPVQPHGYPTPNSSPTANGAGGLYQILGSDYQATVRALAQEGKAHVLARPSILARDGQPATILIGSEVPLITGLSYQPVGTGFVPINNIQYTPVGLQVNVTPYISPNNLVEMIVTPVDSEISQTESAPIAVGLNAPIIDTRSADTVVITPDAQTVVIGGLIKNDKESNVSKIPILGDVPLIGALFRSKTSSDQKNELMIFLTPHIVHAPTELAEAANAPNLTSGMITNSVSEQQLDRFLQRIPNNAK